MRGIRLDFQVKYTSSLNFETFVVSGCLDFLVAKVLQLNTLRLVYQESFSSQYVDCSNFESHLLQDTLNSVFPFPKQVHLLVLEWLRDL